jgi:hypothetical protein
MRVQAKIKASDNAYVVIRTDMGDGKWGISPGFGPGGISRPGNDGSRIDFDRLYGVYESGMFQLTVGQQYLGLGVSEVLDANMPAVKVRLNFDGFAPSFIWGKVDENGSTNDDNANEDTDLYAVNLSFGVGGFDANVYGAMIDDDSADVEKWVVGLHGAGSIGMLNLVTELDVLGGEKTAAVDWEGVQFYLSADANLSDAFKLGGEFFYAAGYDDVDEAQAVDLVDWGSFTVADTNAPFGTDIVFVQNGPFDFTGDGAGVIGASLFGSYKVMDALTLGAKLAYLTPEEDDATLVDSVTSYTVWANYALGSNTSVALGYNLADPDKEAADPNDEAKQTLYARFLIKF